MNWKIELKFRDGIFRLWVLLSVLWAGAILWRSDLSCSLKAALGVTAPWCQFPLVDSQDYYFHLALRMFGAPVAVAVGLFAIFWVVEGFKRRR
jgi:hypothetical protein